MGQSMWDRYFRYGLICGLLVIGGGAKRVVSKCDEKSAICGPECVATERILNLYGLYATASVLMSFPRINSIYVLCFSRNSLNRAVPSSDIFCMTGTMDEMQSVQPQHVLTISGRITSFEEFREDNSQYVLIHTDVQPVQLYEVVQQGRSFISFSFIHAFGGAGAANSVIVKTGVANAAGVVIATTSGKLCQNGDQSCLAPAVHTLVGASLTQCTPFRTQDQLAVQLITGWFDGTTSYVIFASPYTDNSPIFGLQLFRLVTVPNGECHLEFVQDVLAGEAICGVRSVEIVQALGAKTVLLVARQRCPDPQTGMIPPNEANVIIKLWDPETKQFLYPAAVRELADTTGVLSISSISGQFFLCQRESSPSTIHTTLLPADSRVVSTVRVYNQAIVKTVQSRNGDVFLTHVTSIGSVVVDWLSCLLNQQRPSNYSMTPYGNQGGKVQSRNPYRDNSNSLGRPPTAPYSNRANGASGNNYIRQPSAARYSPRGPAISNNVVYPNQRQAPPAPAPAPAPPAWQNAPPPNPYIPPHIESGPQHQQPSPYIEVAPHQEAPLATPAPYIPPPPVAEPPAAPPQQPPQYETYQPPLQQQQSEAYQPGHQQPQYDNRLYQPQTPPSYLPPWQQQPYQPPRQEYHSPPQLPYGNGYAAPSPQPVYPPAPQAPTYYNLTRYRPEVIPPPQYQWPSNLALSDVNPNGNIYGTRQLPMAPQQEPVHQPPPPQYLPPYVPFPSLNAQSRYPTTTAPVPANLPTQVTVTTTTTEAPMIVAADTVPQTVLLLEASRPLLLATVPLGNLDREKTVNPTKSISTPKPSMPTGLVIPVAGDSVQSFAASAINVLETTASGNTTVQSAVITETSVSPSIQAATFDSTTVTAGEDSSTAVALTTVEPEIIPFDAAKLSSVPAIQSADKNPGSRETIPLIGVPHVSEVAADSSSSGTTAASEIASTPSVALTSEATITTVKPSTSTASSSTETVTEPASSSSFAAVTETTTSAGTTEQATSPPASSATEPATTILEVTITVPSIPAETSAAETTTETLTTKPAPEETTNSVVSSETSTTEAVPVIPPQVNADPDPVVGVLPVESSTEATTTVGE
ncbi:hypothetical protein BV898_01327 [Hypsibius exemplaris]|uniref:Uncharacterized protein n=1 Tax=Hypsibius exemplaris TaxID=2072580 RepID=A0A1W0XBD0_HYPEX|nr:hypothetical protein BV898_01327 [Hypsibius exemplaris]